MPGRISLVGPAGKSAVFAIIPELAGGLNQMVTCRTYTGIVGDDGRLRAGDGKGL
jgi:hypothetical protein